MLRGEVFFQDEFQAVRHRLEQPTHAEDGQVLLESEQRQRDIPVRFGPTRSWMMAAPRRSAYDRVGDHGHDDHERQHNNLRQ